MGVLSIILSADAKKVVHRSDFCSLVTSRYDTFNSNKVNNLIMNHIFIKLLIKTLVFSLKS